jgi:ABC-type transporter Mla subunit MlaD
MALMNGTGTQPTGLGQVYPHQESPAVQVNFGLSPRQIMVLIASIPAFLATAATVFFMPAKETDLKALQVVVQQLQNNSNQLAAIASDLGKEIKSLNDRTVSLAQGMSGIEGAVGSLEQSVRDISAQLDRPAPPPARVIVREAPRPRRAAPAPAVPLAVPVERAQGVTGASAAGTR